MTPETLDPARRSCLPSAPEGISSGFFLDAAECAGSDIEVLFPGDAQTLEVVDGTPGGNGLAESLLPDERLARALADAERAVSAFIERPPEVFARSLGEYGPELRDMTNRHVAADEIAAALEALRAAWAGAQDGASSSASRCATNRLESNPTSKCSVT